MSEYLPSFIVQPVLRQARRFSERITGEDSPAGGGGASFSLPAVPDLQRFYPTRFWTQSPPAITGNGEDLVDAPLDHDSIAEEGTLRSIARNIQLWANQINNLDIEDEAIQEQILPSVEQHDTATIDPGAILTDEPETVGTGEEIAEFPLTDTEPQPGSHSLPVLDYLRQPQRTSSETSLNPAHELSYRSHILERNAQGRSHSDPLVAMNTTEAVSAISRQTPQETSDNERYGRRRDGSGALPEDDGMNPLRQRINAVWAGDGTAEEKSKLVHAIMMERYRSTQPIHTPTSSATATSPPFRATSPFSLASVKSEEAVFNLSPADLQPTYAPLDPDDEPDADGPGISKPLGCIHYQRNVKMQCATCEKWYTCRVCHDEVEDHELPRRETKHMLCMICSTPQRVAQTCKMCHVQAAYYYCSICKLWNNNSNKSVYHCDDCGICRLGQGLGKDFFHCKTCGACMSIEAESTHRCIEKSTKCDCPICGEFMFTSSRPVTFMRCGHSIHEDCFGEWCNTSYKCPICSKSIANMESQFRRLDRHIDGQPMPQEYSNNRAYVFCNDCNSRSVVKYHWLGLKCAVCDSYNTAQLELLGPESPALQERADRAQEMGVGEAGITASQTNTPTGDLLTPASRPGTGRATPATVGSLTRQNSSNGTPRSAVTYPGRRDSPFHHLPHSPTRSVRAVSPVVGSYFGTGQRLPASETRRGSYFSVLSFGGNAEESGSQNAHASSSRNRTLSQSSPSQPRPRSSRLSQSYLSPVSDFRSENRGGVDTNAFHNDTSTLEDDDDMDFWGGQSPRSHDADFVGSEIKREDEEEEDSSTDEDDDMDLDSDDDDDDDDPMDVLIGHR